MGDGNALAAIAQAQAASLGVEARGMRVRVVGEQALKIGPEHLFNAVYGNAVFAI